VEYLNIVPTKATRQLAERMIFDAHRECGADSVLDNIADLDPKQTAALIGLLLDATNPPRTRPAHHRPDHQAEERREAHRLYGLMRRTVTPWVIQGNREYQRANRRSMRSRGLAA
jgi:hypothetical protein